jgi:hypothetical protein
VYPVFDRFPEFVARVRFIFSVFVCEAGAVPPVLPFPLYEMVYV